MTKLVQQWTRRALSCAFLAAVCVAFAGTAGAQKPSGDPIRIGSTLALTGPLAQTGLVHKLVGEIFVEQLNARGGLLGRPVEWILLDDQSKADVTRTLYVRLITVDDVDLLMGPYATASTLAAIGVAQRYGKLLIHHTMGIPHLATYERQFTALVAGAHPDQTYPHIVFDAYASDGDAPKSVTIVTSKFPSTQFMAEGTRDVANKRDIQVAAYLEYEFGTRDFGPIAARVKDANADLLWVGAVGVEGNLLLEALSKLGYTPPRHFYLYPASGPLAVAPAGNLATSQTNLEDTPPYTDNPVVAELSKVFHERAKAANMPYPYIDSQAGFSYSAWQILVAAVEATKSLDDEKLADWLKTHEVKTVVGTRNFKGEFNTSETDLEQVRQVQNKKWVTVWPKEHATPGVKLIEP